MPCFFLLLGLIPCCVSTMDPMATHPPFSSPAERQVAPSSVSGPIDIFAISQGRNISSPGPKVHVRGPAAWRRPVGRCIDAWRCVS